ncbi:MAG: hypothetical protein WDO16_18690 [Bacteroidota bacterium]
MRSYPGSKQQSTDNSAKTLTSTVPIQPVNPLQPVSHIPPSGDINKLLSLNKFDKATDIAAADKSLAVQDADNSQPEITSGSLSSNLANDDAVAEITVKSSSVAVEKKQPVTVTVPGIVNNPVATPGTVTGNENVSLNTFSFGSETTKSKQNAIYYPLTIESVVNSYKPKKEPQKAFLAAICYSNCQLQEVKKLIKDSETKALLLTR